MLAVIVVVFVIIGGGWEFCPVLTPKIDDPVIVRFVAEEAVASASRGSRRSGRNYTIDGPRKKHVVNQ